MKSLLPPEMDKSRDVRRGASRFSRQQINKQSGHNLSSGSGGDNISLEKSKKEKLRKLSVVGRKRSSNKEHEMGGDTVVSEAENKFLSQSQSNMSNGTSKRFKLPKRVFYDRNGVGHATVPRKLRSAMKKRNRESVSPPLPDLKKLNHKVDILESSVMDGTKRKETNMELGGSDWSPGQAVSGPITKDEEEVVETLYSLASMFPLNDTYAKSKLATCCSQEKNSSSPKDRESLGTAVEAVKEDLNSNYLSIPEAVHLTSAQTSSQEKVNSSSEPTVKWQPDFPGIKQFEMVSDNSVPQLKLNTALPSLYKTEQSNKKPLLCNPPNVLPELSPNARLKQSSFFDDALLERKPEISLGATIFNNQFGQEHIARESKKTGLALWPGLYSTVSRADGVPNHLLSSVAKIPTWLDGAICDSRTCAPENGSSNTKVSKATISRRSTRSVTHVYISRLIQVLQMSSTKNSPLPSNHLKLHQGSKQQVSMAVNDLNSGGDDLNCFVSTRNIVNFSAERNSYEAKSGVVQNKNLHQDQSKVISACGVQTSQNQSFDFLSLSAGCGGAEAKSGSSKAGNRLELQSQIELPFLHSLQQHHPVMPFVLPRTSPAYSDQLPAAIAQEQAKLQLPPNNSSSLFSHSLQTSLVYTKQHEQQQRLWAANLSAQFHPAGIAKSSGQWANGKQEHPVLIPCSQSITPSALEVLCPRYTPMSQHQQHLVPASMKRQDLQRIPSLYEETAVPFHAASALPLQLLYNECLRS